MLKRRDQYHCNKQINRKILENFKDSSGDQGMINITNENIWWKLNWFSTKYTEEKGIIYIYIYICATLFKVLPSGCGGHCHKSSNSHSQQITCSTWRIQFLQHGNEHRISWWQCKWSIIWYKRQITSSFTLYIHVSQVYWLALHSKGKLSNQVSSNIRDEASDSVGHSEQTSTSSKLMGLFFFSKFWLIDCSRRLQCTKTKSLSFSSSNLLHFFEWRWSNMFQFHLDQYELQGWLRIRMAALCNTGTS